MKTFLWLAVLNLTANAYGSSTFPLKVDAPNVVHAGQELAAFQIDGPDNTHAKATVLDTKGRRVALLQKISNDTYGWDGRDKAGRPVTPGTYLIEIVEEPYLWNGAVAVQR